MTYYPYMHDPDDTLDEAYMRWLDQNGFPAMRELLSAQSCEDAAVLRSVPNRSVPLTTERPLLRDARGRSQASTDMTVTHQPRRDTCRDTVP